NPRVGIEHAIYESLTLHHSTQSQLRGTSARGLLPCCVALRALTSSGLRDRLPLPQPLRDQLRPSPVVPSVQNAQVFWIGAPVNTGRPLVHLWTGVCTRRPVPRRAIGGLRPDLSRPIQLRRVRVPGPFSLPVVEDARRLLAFLCHFAPVSGRQAAVLLP